jgi:hypothetical protein
MLKNIASKSQEFKSIASNPKGMVFCEGNPNILSCNFGHISQRDMSAYIANDGRMETFTCELVLAYLYQYWENETRPKIEAALSEKISSDVFGDLRLIRNILQHDRYRHIADTEKSSQMKVFIWLRNRETAKLTGNAFNAIIYSIALELNRLNTLWGKQSSNMSPIPSFFEKSKHYGLLDLDKSGMEKLSQQKWYREYVLDTNISGILAVEREVLGDLH